MDNSNPSPSRRLRLKAGKCKCRDASIRNSRKRRSPATGPQQLEHYRKAFNDMKQREKPSYPYFFTGIRIGDDFAIVTNPDELFCEIGMSIKKQSPFKHTMVAEQTNGAHGYVPTAKAFEGGSYETWFGEHSYLTTRAGEIIEKESLDILNRLKRRPPVGTQPERTSLTP